MSSQSGCTGRWIVTFDRIEDYAECRQFVVGYREPDSVAIILKGDMEGACQAFFRKYEISVDTAEWISGQFQCVDCHVAGVAQDGCYLFPDYRAVVFALIFIYDSHPLHAVAGMI